MRNILAAALLVGPASLGAAPLISEVMYQPPPRAGAEVPAEEWIELYNPAPHEAPLADWTLAGVSFTFPDLSIPPGGYLVVAADVASFQALHPGVPLVVGGWNGQLANRGQPIVLKDNLGVERDRVHYAPGGDWGRRRPGPDDQGHTGWIWESEASGGGRSLELRNSSLPNGSGQNWAASLVVGGTPGLPNSVASDNVAPLIEEVSHHPPVPGPHDLVLVRARLTDDLGTAEGTVHFRVSARQPGAFQALTMRDDGMRGDEVAGDGIHTALLPAQPNKTVVEFYLEAADGIQQSRTWPAPTDASGNQGANLLYQVDTEEHRGREPLYRLVFSEAEHDEFTRIPFEGPELQTNARFNATFVGQVGDKLTTTYQCGVNLRGDESRDRYPRNLEVHFPPPHSWHGQSGIILNSQFTYNQLLGSLFYREAGLPAYECKSVQVRLNAFNHASELRAIPEHPFHHHHGRYAHVEPLNHAFVDHHFPDDPGGNLYRMQGEGTSWQHFPNSNDLPADYRASGWIKETNVAAGDWSDLHGFLGVMTAAPGPDYLTQVGTVLDLDSWLRTLAVSTILTNGGESLFRGRNNDYVLYRGRNGRFKLLPHDLDTVLGQGGEGRIELDDLPHTLFDFLEDGDSFADLDPLFQQPDVLQRYYRILAELLDGPFSEERANRLIDEALDWTPPDQAALAKEFLAARRTGIRNALDRSLSVSSPLPRQDGFETTADGTAPLTGTFDPATVTAVLVNGAPATLDFRAGSWSFDAANLLPGINRLTVEERDAEGALLASSFLDVHYDVGGLTEFFGPLAANTTLDAAGGPWHVTATIVVPDGLTLTIEPGTSVFFEEGAGLLVEPGGTLLCVGSPFQRIRLTRTPGLSERWLGIDFNAPGGGPPSTTPNKIAYTDMEYGDDQDAAIKVTSSRLTLDHVSWDHADEIVLKLFSPQVEVRDCVFPSVSGAEAVHGDTLVDDDYLVLRGNLFAAAGGYQDIVCINGGRRPGPIFAAYDNVFLGSTDDCLDLNGCDAHVEGNIFQNVRPSSPRTSTSNAVTTDDRANLTIVRNLFYNVDHAVLIKNQSTCVFENNTVVNATIGAINFDEPGGGVNPGSRLDMDSNIFLDCAVVLLNDDATPLPIIAGHRNIIPSVHSGIGMDNLDRDPFLANRDAGPLPASNWDLLPGSPAIGTGRNGVDRGARIPAGAQAFGLPASVTALTSFSIVVDGPAITHYRWRLVTDDVPGPWSADTPITVPITLTNLAEGNYRLDLLARDSAGNLQEEDQFNSSRTWQVDLSAPRGVRINEVFAVASPLDDQVELLNDSPDPVPLNGWFLTDDLSEPQKESLSGLTILAGTHLALPQNFIPRLSSHGESLFLFQGTTLIDSVSWGVQAPGFSIGRLSSGEFSLTHPTLGNPNVRAGTAPPRNLRINEWLATASARYSSGYLELFNPSDAPAPLGGLGLSNSPDQPFRHLFPPLSFVPAGGFASFASNDAGEADPDEIPFSFDPFRDWILLSDSSGRPIDQVRLNCLHSDLAEGRRPDGAPQIELLPLGSPGRSNNRGVSQDTRLLLPLQSPDWRFLDTGTAPADWMEPDFDDRAWESGPAPLGRETSVITPPLATDPSTDPAFDYQLGRINYYFRRTFEFDGDPKRTLLRMTTYLDDGAVFYLNGGELYRHNIHDGPLGPTTRARDTITDAAIEGPFEIPTGRLVNGTNTLAVVTYQVSSNSSDIVFDCNLEVTETILDPPTPEDERMQKLLDFLRITEVMYNPPDGDDAEFIEITNISDSETLSLAGLRLTEGVDFVFPALSLGPGEFVVVVSDLGLFRSIHGPAPNVADEFDNNLKNSSEAVALTLPAPIDVHIQRFVYRSTWHPETDEFGRSLELIDPQRPLSTWNQRSAWIASHKIHGTPGAPNTSYSFQAWAAANRILPGPVDDGDTMSAPLEYAFGLDPNASDYLAVLHRLELGAGGGLDATFLAPALAPPNVTFHLQSSADMATWSTHATRIGNGPWTGPDPVEAAWPRSGQSVAILRLPDSSPTLVTRLLIVITDD